MANAAAAGTWRLGGELEVNRLGFGAMRVTGKGIWGPPADRPTAIRLLRRAVELGCNLLDTADSYGPDVSEELIHEALYPYPSNLVIATKGGLLRPGPDRWKPDARPEHLRQAIDGSLRRLRLERIGLYQLHTVDRAVPYDESIGALVELQKEGKIHFIGVSNVRVDELRTARRLANVVSVQNRFNFDDRRASGVLDVCTREGIAFLPWAPVHVATDHLSLLAERHGASVTQLALAWLLQRSPVVLPIPGTSSLSHLEENVRAAELRVADTEWEEVESAAHK